jgi:hypothetical protein
MHGCCIEELPLSPRATWLVTRRNSGRRWGYDVIRTRPLAREAGVDQEWAYMLELPRLQTTSLAWSAGSATSGSAVVVATDEEPGRPRLPVD